MRDGATADVRCGCGKVPIASSLDQPPAEPVHPLGTAARVLVDSGDASPNRDCIGMYSPTVVRWGWRQPRVLQGAGQHHPHVLVGVAGWGQLRRAMPRWADGAVGGLVARGCPRVPGEDADGAGWDAVVLLSISGGFTERGSVSRV